MTSWEIGGAARRVSCRDCRISPDARLHDGLWNLRYAAGE